MVTDLVLPAHISGKIDRPGDRILAPADLHADDLVGALVDLHVEVIKPDDMDPGGRGSLQFAQPRGGVSGLTGPRLLEP